VRHAEGVADDRRPPVVRRADRDGSHESWERRDHAPAGNGSRVEAMVALPPRSEQRHAARPDRGRCGRRCTYADMRLGAMFAEHWRALGVNPKMPLLAFATTVAVVVFAV